MKLVVLGLVIALASSGYAQQIANPSFVPTWQPKFNLYQTDTITNIKTQIG